MKMDDFFNSNVARQSNSDAKRSELVPKLVSTIHKVPKQIIDTSQMVGVNEQMMKRKLNSGVLVASQIAHDKWLSRLDGFIDSIWLYVIILTVSLTGLNYVSLFLVVLGLWYWWYHIVWYCKAKEWDGNVTSREYTIDTVKIFWKSFISSSVILYVFTAYFIVSKFSYIFQWIIAHAIKTIEIISALISNAYKYFTTNESFTSVFANAHTSITEQQLSDSDVKKLLFDNNITQTQEVIEKSTNGIFLSREEVYDTLNEASVIKNIYIINDSIYYKLSMLMIFILLFILITLYVKKKYEKHYEARKVDFIQDTEDNLKSGFQRKMDLLNNM